MLKISFIACCSEIYFPNKTSKRYSQALIISFRALRLCWISEERRFPLTQIEGPVQLFHMGLAASRCRLLVYHHYECRQVLLDCCDFILNQGDTLFARCETRILKGILPNLRINVFIHFVSDTSPRCHGVDFHMLTHRMRTFLPCVKDIEHKLCLGQFFLGFCNAHCSITSSLSRSPAVSISLAESLQIE